MEYMTRQLVARKAFRHEGRDLEPGDNFEASAVDADYLRKHGKAVEPKTTRVALNPQVEPVGAPLSTADEPATVETIAPQDPQAAPKAPFAPRRGAGGTPAAKKTPASRRVSKAS